MGIFGRRKKDGEVSPVIENESVGSAEIVYRQRIFAERVIFSGVVLQSAYIALKDELLSFRGVTSRLSRRFDTFTYKRRVICKISMTEKTLKVYLPLAKEDVSGEKINVEFTHADACSAVPMLYRVKSGVAGKKALKLIAVLAQKFSLEKKQRHRKINAVNVAEDYLIEYAQRTKKRNSR